jgi:hypothetical protein
VTKRGKRVGEKTSKSCAKKYKHGQKNPNPVAGAGSSGCRGRISAAASMELGGGDPVAERPEYDDLAEAKDLDDDDAQVSILLIFLSAEKVSEKLFISNLKKNFPSKLIRYKLI